MALEIGSIVPGTIVRVAEYGAIVRLSGGAVGLVHISEITDGFVRDVADHFAEGDQVMVKVLSRNRQGKYELSTKDIPQPQPQAARKPPVPRPPRGSMASATDGRRSSGGTSNFEEKLKSFLKESDQRLADLKRNIDAKRGGKMRPRNIRS
jgi:S1 RNA binding domain protein